MATTTAPATSRQLSPKEVNIQMMLAAELHFSTKNCDFQMERYIFKCRNDAYQMIISLSHFLVLLIYIINLDKTWEKLQLATYVIVAIKNPQDIIVQSARPYGQRAVLKFAQHTSAHAIVGRHTPGTFTNHLQTSFSELRLLILTDPRTNHQPIKEAALGNIPTIAFCDTNSPMMVLQIHGTIALGQKWDVMVDLFVYRELEEAKQQKEEEAVVAPDYGLPAVDYGMGALGTDQWPSQLGDQWPTDVVQALIANVPVVSWRGEPATPAPIPGHCIVAKT
ncbi:hypothetical protein REPUB_Repub08aG0110500 [Reevesia pubescens]